MANLDFYQFSFIVKFEDYIVRDHRVHKVRAVPGVTFVDIMYRYLRERGFDLDEVELRNFIFIEPVVATEQFDRQVRVTLTRNKDHWTVKARSQKIKHGEVLSPEWTEHLQGELHLSAGSLTGTLDIEGLKRGAIRVMDADENYSYLRKVAIDHYEFMKLLGNLYIGEGYILAEVHVGDLAKQYLNFFHLHPAYLDGATSIPGLFALNAPGIDLATIKPVIPIYIGSFRTKERFQDKLYVYVEEERFNMAASRDVLYADIDFYNTAGVKIASYTKFGYKQIRSAELITDLQKVGTERREEAVSQPAPAAYAAAGEGVDLRQAIEQDLREMVAKMLGRTADEVGLEDDFYEVGLDSQGLLQLVQELEAKLGQKLYPTLMFEYTDIKKLAEYLEEEYASAYPTAQAEAAATVAAAPAAAPAVATAAASAPALLGADLRSAIEQDLREMVAKMLGRNDDEVGLEDDFYEVGLDSQGLLQLVQELETKLGQKLYPTLMFEYTDIKKLAEYLEEDYGNSYPVQHAASATAAPQELEIAPMAEEQTDVLYFCPVWEVTPVTNAGDAEGVKGCVLLFDENEDLQQALQERLGADGQVILVKHEKAGDYTQHLESIKAQGLHLDKIIWSNSESFQSLFQFTKALAAQKLKHPVQLLYTYQAQETVQPSHAAVAGFARSVGVENPRLLIKAVELSEQAGADQLLKEFASAGEGEHAVRLTEGHRYVQRLRPLDAEKLQAMAASKTDSSTQATLALHADASAQAQTTNLPLRQHGVYLITGGVGGLGLVFARHLAEKAQAKLVLIGRSDLSDDKRTQLRELEALGAEVVYVQGDIARRDHVERIVSEAQNRFGNIHGVVHSAGVIRDAFLARKSLEDVDAVLAPKVSGTLHLDEVLAAEELDFFVLFSSTSALTGNVGQSDYAYANSYLDHYAAYRRQLTDAGSRFGKTLALNWPLWAEGGMQVDAKSLDLMKDHTGMHPLKTENGLAAFEAGLQLAYPQLMLIEGDKPKVLASLQASLARRQEPIGDIEILGVSGMAPTKSFLHLWEKMNRKEKSAIGRMIVEKDDLFSALQAGGKMFHLLVKLDGGREMEVIVSGKGKPMLLINGFGLTSPSWLNQLSEWSSDCQLISIHAPGVGLSKGGADLSLAGISRTFLEVLDELQITEPIHVVAASWGGMVGQTLAHSHPERVKSLTLSCSFTDLSFYEDGLQLDELLKEDFYSLGREQEHELITLSTCRSLKETVRYIQYFDKNDEKQYTTVDLLEDITVPTLVVSGHQDLVIDTKQSQLLHAKIANSELFELEEAGHVPSITHHEAFNERVLTFIQEQDAK